MGLKCWEFIAFAVVLMIVAGMFTVAYGHGKDKPGPGPGPKGERLAGSERNQDAPRYELVYDRVIGQGLSRLGEKITVTQEVVLVTYDTRDECEGEANRLNAKKSGRVYYCRPALSR